MITQHTYKRERTTRSQAMIPQEQLDSNQCMMVTPTLVKKYVHMYKRRKRTRMLHEDLLYNGIFIISRGGIAVLQ